MFSIRMGEEPLISHNCFFYVYKIIDCLVTDHRRQNVNHNDNEDDRQSARTLSTTTEQNERITHTNTI